MADGARSASEAVLAETHAALVAWGHLWSDPGLAEATSVAFSRRLRAALGRATPASGRIVLHAALSDAPPSERLAVLCHEAAHVAAWRIAQAAGTARPRPHGAEWAALVRAAGYEPRMRVAPPAGVPRVAGRSPTTRRLVVNRPGIAGSPAGSVVALASKAEPDAGEKGRPG